MAEIFYHAVPGDWTREEKLRYLAKTGTLSDVAWADIAPNKKHQWLTGDLRAEFDTFIPLEGLNGIFRTVSYGVQTNRDDWVCNFNRETLETGVRTLIETYNSERERWHSKKRKKEQLDDFVTNDNRKIKWSSRLKECLLRNDVAVWEDMRIRDYLYRPFTKGLIYFDPILVHRRSKFPTILPSVESESENRFVWAKIGSEVPFWCLVANHIADSMTQGGTQAIPFYTYDGEAVRDGRISRSRRWCGSSITTATRRSPSGTSSTMSMRCCITRSIVPATPPTSAANSRASRS